MQSLRDALPARLYDAFSMCWPKGGRAGRPWWTPAE